MALESIAARAATPIALPVPMAPTPVAARNIIERQFSSLLFRTLALEPLQSLKRRAVLVPQSRKALGVVVAHLRPAATKEGGRRRHRLHL